MSAKAHAAQLKLESLVDTVAVQEAYRPAIVALVTHAYIMGLSDGVVEQHKTTEDLARLAHELAGPIGIKIEGPKQTQPPKTG